MACEESKCTNGTGSPNHFWLGSCWKGVSVALCVVGFVCEYVVWDCWLEEWPKIVAPIEKVKASHLVIRLTLSP